MSTSNARNSTCVRNRRYGLCHFTIAAALAFSGSAVWGQPQQEEGQQAEFRFSDMAENGILIVDGRYVEGPYLLEATSGRISVNEAVVTIEEPSESHGEKRAQQWQPRRGGGRGQRGRERNGERRRAGEHREYEEDDEYEVEDEESPNNAVRVARTVADWLHSDFVVILTSNGRTAEFADASRLYPFFELLLSSSPTADQIAWFEKSRPKRIANSDWMAVLDRIEITPALRAEIESRMQTIEQLEQENRSHILAVKRLDNFSYPLTIAGMLLGVIAFGHMLQWSGRGLAAMGDKNVSAESVRYGVVALWLMMGMSLVDLAWTILASQAGAMTEINPLAARLVNSASQLALFKVVATGVGMGILYAWRRRSQIQQATWWMCLVCVLLTFRWVVFDSLSG